jgi:MFS family permease
MAGLTGVYRGWWVLAALFVTGMMVYGGGLYGFSLMVPPLSEEFGWSRAATAGLVSVFWLAAPLTPLGGRAIERFGAVRVVCAGVVLETVCLALVSFTDSLTVMYVLRGLMGVGKIMMMAGVTAQASAWFRRRFGLAIAICYAGWHFGGLTIAPLTQYLIDGVGWRSACLIMAALIAALSLPAMWLLGGGKPTEEELAFEAGPAEAAVIDDKAAALRALRTWAFWSLAAITALGSFTYGALLGNEAALVEGGGLGAGAAAMAVSLTAGAAMVGALAMGTMSDRLGFAVTMTIELVLLAIGAGGFLLLLDQPSVPLMLLAAGAFGLAVGGFDTCLVAHLQRRFGAPSFNDLFGVWYFFYLAVLFGGPILAGRMFDLTGSYQTALIAMLAGLVVAALLLATHRTRAARA